MSKRNILTLIIFFLHALVLKTELKGQSISIGAGPIFTHTNAITPVVNGKEDFQNTAFATQFGYKHYMKRHSIHLIYSKYVGCSTIRFEDGGWIGTDGAPVLGYGFCGGVELRRFDIGTSYNLINLNRQFYMNPSFSLGIQRSRLTGVTFWEDGEPVNGPYYFELEPMQAIPMKTIQVAPIIGLNLGFVFWKRLDIGLNVQGVYAFKPYQKMYLKYQYKGVVQPEAEYESTGTGVFVTIGIGYRFAKFIK
jgi:hypothetical protein